MKYQIKRRSKKLVRKFTTSPTLPILGWTKWVESIVTADAYFVRWLLYASLVTLVWISGVILWEAVQETAEDAVDSLDGDEQ